MFTVLIISNSDVPRTYRTSTINGAIGIGTPMSHEQSYIFCDDEGDSPIAHLKPRKA